MKNVLRHWKNLNALLILLLVVSLLIGPKHSPPAGDSGLSGTLPLIILMLIYINFIILCIFNFRELRKPANLMTLLRTFGTLPFVLIPWEASRHWMIVFPLLSLLALSDLADGFIARRTGGNRFGAFLDEETDAFFTAVLSYLLFTRAGYGSWVLAFGGIRPVFFILFFITGRASAYPSAFSRFSKTICAISAAVLVGVTAVILPGILRTAALGLTLGGLIVSFVWEAWLNMTGGRYAAFFGLASSFIIYYGIPFKALRMRRFYAGFLSRGSLAFDIGSHIGNRIGVWSRLGAEVVAVEPNPLCTAVLGKLHGRRGNLHIHAAAVGSSPGRGVLHSDPSHPTLATLSEAWIRDVKQTAPFRSIEWSRESPTEVITLDQLIEEYGVPDFCKIDVEGYELEVLKGLSIPLPALSIEYLPSAADLAEKCIRRLSGLGSYEYNLSRRETMRFVWDTWQEANEVEQFLNNLNVSDRAGDIYARLRKL